MRNLKERARAAFDAWEVRTAARVERWTKNRALLAAIGFGLTRAVRTKERTDRALSAFWRGIGLPDRRDQERVLHALGRLESRIIDLEETLEDGRGH